MNDTFILFSFFNLPFIHTTFHDPKCACPVDITAGTAGCESTRASLMHNNVKTEHQDFNKTLPTEDAFVQRLVCSVMERSVTFKGLHRTCSRLPTSLL